MSPKNLLKHQITTNRTTPPVALQRVQRPHLSHHNPVFNSKTGAFILVTLCLTTKWRNESESGKKNILKYIEKGWDLLKLSSTQSLIHQTPSSCNLSYL
jgi:hypothetical protein